MAVVQPFDIQQPVLAMAHVYVPVAYQITAAPQPPVATAPAVQLVSAMQMPVSAVSTVPPAPSPHTQAHPRHRPLPRHTTPTHPSSHPPFVNSEPPTQPLTRCAPASPTYTYRPDARPSGRPTQTPTSGNPRPFLDIWGSSPYRHVLA